MRTPDTTPGHGGSTKKTTVVPVLPVVQSYDRETIWRETHLSGAGEASSPTQQEAKEVARQRDEHVNPQTPADADSMRERILDSEERLKHEPEVKDLVDVRSVRVGW